MATSRQCRVTCKTRHSKGNLVACGKVWPNSKMRTKISLGREEMGEGVLTNAFLAFATGTAIDEERR